MTNKQGSRQFETAADGHGNKPHVLIAANSSWNLQHFRSSLIEWLVGAGYSVTTISPDEEPVSIQGVKIAHRVWKMDRSSLGPVGNFVSFVSLLALLHNEQPDAFLAFTIKPNIFGSLACRCLDIPAIPNVSGLGTTFLTNKILRRAVVWLYRLAFRRAFKVFFQNSDDCEVFQRQRIVDVDQGRVLPGSGIDPAYFSWTPAPTELQFLMISRLLRDKGVREYVGAAQLLRKKLPHARFALVGELDPKNRTAIGKRELQQWIAEGAIDYLGSTSDVRPFIQSCSAVVLPSYREGLPRTLLEGAAMGRPLIAADVPGCREVVRDGLTGFLCARGSIQSLADAMEKFAHCSYATRQQMGREARAMAEREYDQQLVFDAYSEVLADVVRPICPRGDINEPALRSPRPVGQQINSAHSELSELVIPPAA